jgi:putative transposase
VSEVCKLFGYTRQAYYKSNKSAHKTHLGNAVVLTEVGLIRQKVPRLGTGKLHFLLKDSLKEHGIKMGRDKMYKLLADYNMLIGNRRTRKPITTNSNHPFYRYRNLIKEMKVTRINQLWVSDITYLRVNNTFLYLSLVTDAFSRKIVGHYLSTDLKTEGPLAALQMALKGYLPHDHKWLIHHSDRGIQYCCGQYTRTLMDHNIQISMTQNGDPYENPLAERMNGILKNDFELYKTFRTMEELRLHVNRAVENYNNFRPHLSLNMKTPQAVHCS